MSQTARILQLIGTFLPIYGMAATVLAAILLPRGWRAAALWSIPAATMGLIFLFGENIGTEGNMLFVALYILFIAILSVYYPVLFIISLIFWVRASESSPTKRGGHE